MQVQRNQQKFEYNGLGDFMDESCLELRKKWKEFSKQEIFRPRFNLSLREEKELALEQLKVVATQKVFSVKDFKSDPLKVFANHEMAGYISGSLATKMTVQLNLFGGTVFTLGTERHLAVAEGVDNLSTIGCFALTELGYGNNAVQMETTSHYNAKDQTFTINSPSVLSQKYWITNGAYHCNYAIVFAQLIMPGEKKMGVHAFLIRVRNEDGSICKGVFIEDMGAKFGLNGVDNGRLKFTNVVAPRESLLNRYSDVTPQGEFKSSINNLRQRFLSVADRLLSGRICIASMIGQAAKLCLLVGIRYGNQRMAVGTSGKSDTPISEFGLFQNQIYPLLAKTMILNVGMNTIKRKYAQELVEKDKVSKFVVILCCSIKPLVTWNARDVATTVVERVGGQGYLACNRVSEVLPFAHSGITAEGDNGVLMQKTAKELLDLIQNGEYKTPKPVCKKENYDFSNYKSYLDLLRVKESVLIKELIDITMKKMEKGSSIYQIWMRENNDLVQGVARIFGERQVVEYAIENIEKAVSNLKPVFNIYLNMYLNKIVFDDLGWFIYNELISTEQAKSISQYKKEFIQDVHKIALDTVNNFGIPEHLITAPIAQNYEKFNDGENNGEVYRPKL